MTKLNVKSRLEIRRVNKPSATKKKKVDEIGTRTEKSGPLMSAMGFWNV
jgi:hypothetical protein